MTCRPCDLAISEEGGDGSEVAEQIVQTAVEAFGRVSYLVNCAGIPGGFAASTDTKVEVFDAVQRLNVRATWLLQRAAIRRMVKQELADDEYVLNLEQDCFG